MGVIHIHTLRDFKKFFISQNYSHSLHQDKASHSQNYSHSLHQDKASHSQNCSHSLHQDKASHSQNCSHSSHQDKASHSPFMLFSLCCWQLIANNRNLLFELIVGDGTRTSRAVECRGSVSVINVSSERPYNLWASVGYGVDTTCTFLYIDN